jgi:RNA polymerase sigma-70 factor (ECF subfamily)
MNKALTEFPVAGEESRPGLHIAAVTTRPVEGENDADLLIRIAAGDKAAFTVLAERYYRPLSDLAYRHLGRLADAEDVAQDALLRIWQKAGLWERRDVQPRSWIYRIAYNLVIDEVRKHRPTETLDGLDELPASTSTERELEQVNIRRHIDAGLRSLPERQRTAIALCALHGLANYEAAAIMELSVDALESLLARGRRGLRQYLQETGVGL